MPPRFVVLGRTRGLGSSRRILGRYKGVWELRDVFNVDRLSKAARSLLVFEVVGEPDDGTWFLVSFDFRGVSASKEYSEIKGSMYWSLCGRLDNSTYICPYDASDIPLAYTPYVEVLPVKPHNDRARIAMAVAVRGALEWVVAEAHKAGARLRGRGVARAKEILAALGELLKAPWMSKVRKLLGGGVERLSNARAQLEGALASRTPATRKPREVKSKAVDKAVIGSRAGG